MHFQHCPGCVAFGTSPRAWLTDSQILYAFGPFLSPVTIGESAQGPNVLSDKFRLFMLLRGGGGCVVWCRGQGANSFSLRVNIQYFDRYVFSFAQE